MSELPRPPVELVQRSKSVTDEAFALTKDGITSHSKDTAVFLLDVIGALDKEHEEFFAKIKNPINEARNAVLKAEHEVRDPLADAKKALRSAFQRYLAAERVKALAPAPGAMMRPPEKVEGLHEVPKWEFEITNPEEVTRPYCSPDNKKIRHQVEALGEPAEALVGGIKVLEGGRLINRRKV